MFIGHFAVGFASKRLAPKASLGPLMLAPVLLDVLWPIFLVLGIESVKIVPGDTVVTPLDLHDFPWSHSLLMALVWSTLAGLGYFGWKRDRRTSLVIAAGVFSHWVLDFVSHRPDLQLWPGGSVWLGLGLWNSRAGTLAVEGSMWLAAVASYATFTKARSRTGTIAFWAFVALLTFLYASDFVSPPPPSVQALEVVSFVAWLFIPWAAWFDRNRELVDSAATPPSLRSIL
jgi:hypothetical protein